MRWDGIRDERAGKGPFRKSPATGPSFLLPLITILTFLGSSLGAVASAGVNTWTTNGPGGGRIQALAIDPATPTTIYVGTEDAGIFKSTDGGGRWTAINTGLTVSSVGEFAIDPAAAETIYAGTGEGVFKSTNAGASWTAINSGLTTNFGSTASVAALAIDPANTATVYAGTSQAVFKSTNGGASWSPGSEGLTGVYVRALAIDPSSTVTVYAGTSGGVFKSTNAGASWTSISSGLTNTDVIALEIELTNPAVLYAGTFGVGGASAGVFKSINGGVTWTNSGLTNNSVFALAIDPSSPVTVYAGSFGEGVFKSTNGGSSWTSISTGLTDSVVAALDIDPMNSANLYAGGYAGGGIFKSSDSGESWRSTNTGLTNTMVQALVIDPSAPDTVYAGAYGTGIFKSNNGGGSWASISTDLLTVRALAVDPSSPATVYAGTENGVFKTIDAGARWTAMTTGLNFISVHVLRIDPRASTTIYAGRFIGGVFKSTNGGTSWTAANTGFGDGAIFLYDLAIDPTNPAILYAAAAASTFTSTTCGVYKTTNGGANWTAVLSGQTSCGIRVLTIDPSSPGTVYAGQAYRVLKSTDGGASWVAYGSGIPCCSSISSLTVDPSNPATIYAGTAGAGIFKSTDAGGSWTAINAGLNNRTVEELAIHPSMPTRIYAGTGGGVYEYTAVEPCVAGSTTLCLSGGRFKVTTQWTTRDGQSGSGQAVALTADTGYFTFFNPGNVEMLVKVLNACALNSRFWTFAGGLTDVQVVMTVTDSLTGAVKTYTNPQGTPFQPIQDTGAFDTCAASSSGGVEPYDRSGTGWLLPPSVTESVAAGVPQTCVANATTLCLSNSRYQVQAQWLARDGTTGAGQVIPLTADTGAFWFFSPTNVEMVVKVLNACGLNSRYWTFAGGLTDVNVILTVTDTQTGTVKTYANPQGTPFQPIQDTDAFHTCP